MVAVSILIIILFIVFIIKNDRHAILAYVPCSILFPNYICLKYSPPALTLHFVLDVIVVMVFLAKRHVKYNSFPFYKAYVFLVLLMFLGIVVSPQSFSQLIFSVFSNLISYFIVIVFYFELRKKEDVRFSTIVLGFSFGLLCLYALSEYFFQTNFLHEYIYQTNNPEYLNGKLYLTHEVRYSSIRCSSVFPISISWGGFCCLVLSYFSCFYVITKYKPTTIKYILFVFMVAFGVIISGSRASMFYFAIIILGALSSMKKRIGLFLIIIAGAALILEGDYYELLIRSMHSDNDIVVGSSVDMRYQQFDAAYKILSESPIWGLGVKGISIALKSNSDILGSESIWLQQFITFGLIGVSFQIYLYYCVLRELMKQNKGNAKLLSGMLGIGWIVFSTLTTSPGLSEPYFLSIVVLLIKSKNIRHYESVNYSPYIWRRKIY